MNSDVLGPLLLLVCVALAVKGLGGKRCDQVGYRRGRFLCENEKAFPERIDRSTLDPFMAIEVDDRWRQRLARRRRDARERALRRGGIAAGAGSRDSPFRLMTPRTAGSRTALALQHRPGTAKARPTRLRSQKTGLHG
jgi:hypothetical protein